METSSSTLPFEASEFADAVIFVAVREVRQMISSVAGSPTLLPQLVAVINDPKYALLYNAAVSESVEMVRLLLSVGDIDNTDHGGSDNTSLINVNLYCTGLTDEEQKTLNCGRNKAKKGEAPIHVASFNCDTSRGIAILELLLDAGADINAQTRFLDGHDNNNMLALTIGATADIPYTGQHHFDLRTPLFLAVESYRFPTVAYLLARGANPNIADRNGVSALHMCCADDGGLASARLLVGATNPLDYVRRHVAFAPWAKRLLKDGGDSMRRNLLGPYEVGTASADDAGSDSDSYGDADDESRKKRYAFPNETNVVADISIQDRNGRTAMDYAKELDDEELIQLLEPLYTQ